MATISRKPQVVRMDDQQYETFTQRVKGNISPARQAELYKLGKAMRNVRTISLDGIEVNGTWKKRK